MNITDDAFATYKLLATEFKKRGYQVTIHKNEQRLTVVTYTSPTGQVWQTLAKNIGYPFTSREAADLFDHKDRAYSYVSEKGLSIPATYYVPEGNTVDEVVIQQMLQDYKKLIVKPEDSSLSRGLSLNLTTAASVLDGIKKAQRVKPGVIIQEQVVGEEIRFVIIKGKIQAALLRRTPRVVGDGHHTIAELLVAENEVRQTLQFPYIHYPQLTDKIIDSSFFTNKNVPKDGEIIEFNHATMIKNGSSVYNVLDQVHPSYIETVERSVRDIGTKFMVSDLFFADFTQPQQAHNYWFIEFNTSPVLKLCYGCRDGKMFDVIPLLVDLIDEHINRDKTID